MRDDGAAPERKRRTKVNVLPGKSVSASGVRGNIPGTSTAEPDANNAGAESDPHENSTKDSGVETAMVTCDEAAAAQQADVSENEEDVNESDNAEDMNRPKKGPSGCHSFNNYNVGRLRHC